MYHLLCIVEMDIGLEEMEEPQQQLYDCCICSQCTPSTNERLVGLVTLLQPSSGMLCLSHVLSVTTTVISCIYFQYVCAVFRCLGTGSTQHPVRFQMWNLIFTCVSYAEARNRYRLDVCPSVRPSVRPSHAGIVLKRLNILSCFLRHTIAHSF